MRAGVISVQGAFPEHIDAFNRAIAQLGLNGEAVAVRRRSNLRSVECLVLPGGETTTISKLLKRFSLFEEVVEMGKSGVPIMGTCAGCVLLSKRGDMQVEQTGTELLGLMDMSVRRNAFGRQRESFEVMLEIKGLESPFPAVFIRAPVIEEVNGDCEICATYDGRIVMARQNNFLGLSFHPELCSDTRIHQMLLEMI
jgi:5'-phosphate synthase pdxT subunit